MADPVKKPLTWSKAYPVYAEKFDMYRVFQELLKELIIRKPSDPLAYIRDEIPNVARLLHSPRVFLVGPNLVAQAIGLNLAAKSGAKYLTLADIVEAVPESVREILAAYVEEEECFDEGLRKLLIATVLRRLSEPDCQHNGYVLYGFPQNRAQAMCAQQSGLLPRQVFILLPDPSITYARRNSKRDSSSDPLSDYMKSQTALPKLPSYVTLPEMGPSKMKDISEVFDFEICKMISYERWFTTVKEDIEAEFLSNMISVKPCGSPWIPKILIIGPPASGKSMVSNNLSSKFSLVNIDFTELIRGAISLDDDVGKACAKYLADLLPMNETFVKELLKRRMLRDDCTRKGWVLHGFPHTAGQLYILEALQLVPNRIFFLQCSDEECNSRMQELRKTILQRRFPGEEETSLPWIDEMNYGEFPYGRTMYRIRYEAFLENLNDISKYYGKRMIFVDASQTTRNVMQFIESSLLRPPIIRYPDVHESTTGAY